jgi:hypothetical protein
MVQLGGQCPIVAPSSLGRLSTKYFLPYSISSHNQPNMKIEFPK